MTTHAPTPALPVVAAPGPERSVWYSGWLVTFLATGEETGGAWSLTEVTGRRGHSAAPPWHVHTREEECFFVIEGEISCLVRDREIRVPAGGFVVLPRDVPHRYKLVSEEARLLNLCSPAGFEGFYRAMAEPAAALSIPPEVGAPDIPRLLAAAADHGVRILPGPPAA